MRPELQQMGFLFAGPEEKPYTIAFDASRSRLWSCDPEQAARETGGRWNERERTISLKAMGMDF